MNSKQRRTARVNQQRRGARDTILARLRSQNASCGNCAHIEDRPFSSLGHSCALESVGGTYMPVQPEGLCVRWKDKRGG